MSGNRPLRGTPADIAARESANAGGHYGGANISKEEYDQRMYAKNALKHKQFIENKNAREYFLGAEKREKEEARIIAEEEAEFAKWKKENGRICDQDSNSQVAEVDNWEEL